MDIKSLKGVSEKREKQLNKLGINTVEDLVKHFPRDFVDLRHTTLVRYAYHNDMILTRCQVLQIQVNRYAKMPVIKALCQQDNAMFQAVWFNQPYVASKLRAGEYLMYGRVQNKYGFGNSLVNPTFEEVENATDLRGIVPVYSLSDGLSQKVMRNLIKQALGKICFDSAMPRDLQKKYEVMPLKDAYYRIHDPRSQEDIDKASARIALEEYFLLICAFKVIKGDRTIARLNPYSVTKADLQNFIARFPFELTEGQQKAVDEIFDNVKSPHVMNRLLQGDVGSGKTAVAMAGIYMAVKSGYQVAMLAPTEVLATQNADLLKKFFPDYNVQTLVGSTPTAEKRVIKKGLANGEVPIVCGTHAVIQKDVQFQNLAFVVCDEQHRFGVAQRSALAEKGEGVDTLIMSATPIPRTLSLIFYGDLDITTIKDKPKSRQPISTSIIPEKKLPDMYRYIQEQAHLGNQSYFVCPKIEEDEEGTVKSVTELHQELQQKMPTLKIGLLHGKMKDKQKEEVMTAFKNKEYDCLVSTTVIEVGVDVPSATIMVIYNAERFGLSQLHQLRGRVGRGAVKSYCFLLCGVDSEQALERLTVMREHSDGFEIAEMDLKMRGSGDFMGTRQSGHILTEIKNLKFPSSTLFTAKALADEAFSGQYNTTQLWGLSVMRYDQLKDVVLN